jgi:hypothetical protein
MVVWEWFDIDGWFDFVWELFYFFQVNL